MLLANTLFMCDLKLIVLGVSDIPHRGGGLVGRVCDESMSLKKGLWATSLTYQLPCPSTKCVLRILGCPFSQQVWHATKEPSLLDGGHECR